MSLVCELFTHNFLTHLIIIAYFTTKKEGLIYSPQSKFDLIRLIMSVFCYFQCNNVLWFLF